jgi:hypothetical protein
VSGYLQVGLTPVIISNTIEWLSLDDWASRTQGPAGHDRKLAQGLGKSGHHRYRPTIPRISTRTDEGLTQWVEQKRKVNASKELDQGRHPQHQHVFRNPGKDDYVVVTFEQDYRSNNAEQPVLKKRPVLDQGRRPLENCLRRLRLTAPISRFTYRHRLSHESTCSPAAGHYPALHPAPRPTPWSNSRPVPAASCWSSTRQSAHLGR